MNKTELNLSRTYTTYTIGKAISIIVNFSLLPLFTRALPKEQFGVIGIIWIFIPLLNRSLNLGMDVGISVRFFKLDKIKLSNCLYNGIFAITLLSMFVWLVGIVNIDLIKVVIYSGFNKETYTLLILSCYFSSVSAIMLSFLKNSGKAVLNVIFTIVPSVILGTSAYLLVLFWRKDFSSYIWSLFLSNAIAGCIAYYFYFKNYPVKNFKFSPTIIKSLLKVGLPTVPGLISNVILSSGDRYMIKYFIGIETVAIYTLGYRFSEQISQALFQPFLKAFTPAIYQNASKCISDSRVYCIGILKNIVILMVLTVAFFSIFINDILYIMGNGDYNNSYLIFIISIVGILIWLISSSEISILIFLEKTFLTMSTVFITAILNIILNYFMIPIWGIVGAAFATVLSYTILLFIRGYLLQHLTGYSFHINALKRIVPLCLYLSFTYYIDNLSFSNYVLYSLKLINFLFLAIFYWLCFKSFRNFLISFYSNKFLSFIRIYKN